MKKILKKITKIIPTKIYLKIKYRLKIGKKLNLKHPQTYNEKIQWLKINDKNEKYIKLVDKYEVKKYVEKKIGKEHIIPTIGVYKSFKEIKIEELPKEFVMKCTHDSGGVIICKDKNKINWNEIEKKINKLLKENYYYSGREWPYKKIQPRIIVEKYMVDESGTELKDYKFFCFNGRAKMLFVAKDRPFATKFNFYDMNFNKLPFKQHYENFEEKLEKPIGFEKMVKLAEKLSEGLKHVRVDFYNINGEIYFGEMTFYHFSGFEKFEPEEWDEKVGDMFEDI